MKYSLDKITLSNAHNTSKRARSYMSAYVNKAGKSHLLIEKFVKIHKCHRNILDQETKYLDTLKVKTEGYVKEWEEEHISIKNEEETERFKIKKEVNKGTEKVDKASA